MVTDKEVLKHLQGLKRKCAVGLDNIPASFLKDTKYVISKPLAHIINCSLKSGIVPSDFKQARVAPIYKSADRVNYRPISILPAVSKILEKCVHRQLMDHIETHQLLSQFQFGFRKHHSTELATVYFTDEIRKAMDKGMLTGAIYIDLSKAFDTISHSSIIEKLPDFGITGMPQQWMAATYSVAVNKFLSMDGNPLGNLCSVVFHKDRSWDLFSFSYISTTQQTSYRNAILQSMLTTLYFIIHTKILMRLKR